jgi:ParB family chromosome partitioning protein
MEGFGLTREQLANRLGKSRAAVTNTLRLAQLPASIRDLVLDGSLTEGHARALLGLQDEEQMQILARRIQAEKLSVRKTEELVRDRGTSASESQGQETKTAESKHPEEFEEASRLMQEALGLRVQVKPYRRGGKVEIRFRGTEELESLLSLLTEGNPQQ